MLEQRLQNQLRQALSHLKKARKLDAECRAAHEAKTLSEERFTTLSEFYAGHTEYAHAEVQQVKSQIRHLRDQWIAQCQRLEGQQTALTQHRETGHISPAEANRSARQIAAKIEEYRQAIARCEQLLPVEEPAELGGFIDQPLERYRLGEEAQTTGDLRWGRLAAFMLPFLLALSIFLPWVTVDGATMGLYAIGSISDALGLPASYAGYPAETGWLPFFVLPLAALPFAAMSRNKAAGYGLIGIGFALIWLLAGAILVTPLFSQRPGIGLATLIRALHVGPFAYMAGGVALIYLGRKRVESQDHIEETGGRAMLVMSAMLVIFLAITAGMLHFNVSEGEIRFSVQPRDNAPGVLEIQCKNEHPTPITMHIPWPEGTPDPSLSPSGKAVGIVVHVREREEEAFSLLQNTGNVWNYQGMPVREDNAVVIAPKSTAQIILDARRLVEAGADPAAIRLEFTDAGGSVLDSFAYTMPDRLATANATQWDTAPIASDTPSGLNGFQGPESVDVPPSPPDSADPMPGSPIAEPTPAPDPAIKVRITGMLGERIRYEIIPSGDEAGERATAQPGDPITGGWSYEAYQESPPAVVLRHEDSGETVQAPVGDTVTLP